MASIFAVLAGGTSVTLGGDGTMVMTGVEDAFMVSTNDFMKTAFYLLLLLELGLPILLTPCASMFAMILLPSVRRRRHVASIFGVLAGWTSGALGSNGTMGMTWVDTWRKKIMLAEHKSALPSHLGDNLGGCGEK